MSLRKIFLWLFVLVFLYQYFFTYVDFANGCFIRISPSLLEWNNLTMKRALRVLKYGAPADYRDTCANVRVINPNMSCGGWNGGCFHAPYDGNREKARKIDISTAHGSLLWTTGVIVHETCHLKQYLENRPLEEAECYNEDDRVLRELTLFE